ncbi:MAG: spore photoproduct lyase family protein [Planctomycetota bacterium]
MYVLKPDHIFAHEALKSKPDALERLRRFLNTMGRSEADVDWYAPTDVFRVSSEVAAWSPDKNAPQWKLRQPVVFTNFVTDGSTAEDDPILKNPPAGVALHKANYILGYMLPYTFHHTPEKDAESRTVCWPSKFLGSVAGCPHGCVYCGDGRGGKALVIALNVREYVDQVLRPILDDNPWQRCFLMIGMGADMATLEPEYGLYEDFLNLLSKYEDRYAYFHTNGDHVDWVERLTHRERLIGVWSLCSNEAAAVLEPCAPPASSRIDAMAKLNRWGVPVRVKMKPVLPVRGWQESYANCIKELLTTVKPETLGFTCLIWNSFEQLQKMLDTNLLDPTFIEAARNAQEEMKDSRHGPFPHSKRAETYRFLIREARKHAPKLPLFLSTETNEMWEELAPELGQKGRKFFCGCNPIQGPGPRFLKSDLTESNFRTNKKARRKTAS